MYILSSLLCLGVFCLIAFYWTKRRLYKLSSTVPGPVTLPFIGSVCLFLQKNPSEFTERFLKLFEEYPDLSKVWIGTELCYLVTKPEYVKIIFNNNGTLEKSGFLYKPVKALLGNGLVTGAVKIWRMHRKAILPSFSQSILDEYPQTVCQQCDILINVLSGQCNKCEIDFFKYATNCLVNIMCETVFGVSVIAQIKSDDYSYVIHRLAEIVFLRVFRLAYSFDCIFAWTEESKEQKRLSDKIKKVTCKLIEEKMRQMHGPMEDENSRKIHFFDLIFKKYLNNEFSLEELEDETITFLLAGVDATATSLSFFFTLLGMNKDIQQSVYEEVMEVLGPEGRPTAQDLPKLKYTESVINESLRLFPGAPFLARAVTKDISLDNVIIPKGSNVCVSLLYMQRSEKYWKDPLKFDPDRFLREKKADKIPYTYLPFSAGPRNCIGCLYCLLNIILVTKYFVGIKLAMMLMKTMTAMIIRQFQLTSSYKSVEDIELVSSLFLQPKNDYKLVFKRRN